ncbi:DUF2089 family protein [Leuconostoc fallax]|uniref:DUF2089 domain-containing protein n=1 Tax=Leuconostoc fallax TaxID=1251 RepID=A0A4R5NB39_9LACO|nr:DUF2089 family protein [Leuconostoc fallax]MBU7456433.1 DUF2089 family protein [Leuconostoc fallax]TDG69437.1 hypothetical protein C5L23_000899 [Leuconostoc fallax]
MEWFFRLEPEEQVFIKRFLLSSGSLKQLAREYDVSYPTVRLRLDRLIEKIKFSDVNKDSFELEIMQMVINERLTLAMAKEIIQKHKESIDG